MTLESAQHKLSLPVVEPSLSAMPDLTQDREILLPHEPELWHSEQPSVTAAWENIPMHFPSPQPLLGSARAVAL